jgi:hypothetical protein
VLITLLGLLASASFITMNYVLDKRVMLLTQTIGMISVGSQFGLKGIWGVTIINFIFIVRNVIVYLRDKRWDKNSTPTLMAENKRQERIQLGVWFLFVVSTMYFVVTPIKLSEMTLTTAAIFIFPLLAAITNVLALAQQNVFRLKLWIISSTLCWVMFDTFVGSWQNLIGDVFGFIAGTIAVVKIINISKRATDTPTVEA